MEKAYYSVKDLSEYTSIPESTIYQWVRFNQVPFTRLNGVIRFRIDTINKWLAARTVQPKKVVA